MSASKALESCIRNRDYDGMKFCLDNGADPKFIVESNSYQENYCSILDLSICLSNEFEYVKLLIDYGADVNQKNDDGSIPLHSFCQYNNCKNRDILHLLLNSGSEINMQDETGRTPLHYAAKSVSPEVCRVLLNYGADTKIKDFIEDENCEYDNADLPIDLVRQDNYIYLRIKAILDPSIVINEVCRKCIINGEADNKCLYRAKIKRKRVIAQKSFCHYYLEHIMLRDEMRAKSKERAKLKASYKNKKRYPVIGCKYKIVNECIKVL